MLKRVSVVLCVLFFCELLAFQLAMAQQESNEYKKILAKLLAYEKTENDAWQKVRMICKMIEDKNASLEILAKEIKKLEEIIKEYPLLRVKTISVVCDELEARRGEDDNAMAVLRAMVDKVMFLSLDDYDLKSGEKIIIRSEQLLLGSPRSEMRDESISDCNPVFRKKFIEHSIKLYLDIVGQIDNTFSRNDDKNIPYDETFLPSDSYKGEYYDDRDAAKWYAAEDESTLKAYKNYIEKHQKKEDRYRGQNKARETKFLYGQSKGNGLGLRITYFYSLPPYNSAELGSIFKETKFDPAWAREILDEVRKAEKEYPDDGFRIWQSVDALFRVDAKFISINDKNEAVLEKRNGKKTTIEIDILRQHDKDYLKRLHKKQN
jgi:hypothetical protein